MVQYRTRILTDMFRRMLKYLVSIVLTVVACFGLFLILLQTSWLRGILQEFALDAVNNAIQGRFEADVVQGNLFSRLTLNNVTLTLDGEIVCAVRTLDVEYDAIELVGQRIAIQKLELDSLSVHLVRNRDSIWNIQQALASREPVDSAPSGSFDWAIRVDSLNVKNSRMLLISEHRSINVQNFTLLAGGEYKEGSARATVRTLSCVAENPSVELRHCALSIAVDSAGIVVNDAVVATRQNLIEASGQYRQSDQVAEFELRTGPLHLSEFKHMFAGVPADRHPTVHLTATVHDTEVTSSIAITEGSTGMDVDLVLRINQEPMAYSANGSLREFTISGLIDDGPDISPLNGTFSLTGKGFDPATMEGRMDIDLGEMSINQVLMENLSAVVHMRRGGLRGAVVADAPFGTVAAEGSVAGLSDGLRFSLDGRMSGLNIVSFTGIGTSLAGKFSADGIAQGSDGPEVSFLVEADSSEIDSFLVNSISVAGRFSGGILYLDSLVAAKEGIRLSAHGDIDNDGLFSADYSLLSDDLSRFMPPSAGDSLKGTATLEGKLWGSADSIASAVHLRGSGLSLSRNRIGDVSVDCRLVLRPDSVVSISAESLVVTWDTTEWKNVGPLKGQFGQNRFQLEPVKLVSGEQSIDLETEGQEGVVRHLILALKRFQIHQVASAFLGLDATGILNLEVQAERSGDSSRAESSLLFEQGMHNGLELPRVRLQVKVADSLLSWDMHLATSAGNVVGEGALPLMFTDTTASVSIDDEGRMRAVLQTDQFDLSLLRILESSPVAITGLLSGNVTISGPVNAPEVEGFVAIDSGSVTHPSSGLHCKGIRLRLTGNRDVLVLEDLAMGNGAVTGSGSVGFRYQDSLVVEPHLRFLARNFDLLTGPTHTATISGEVTVEKGGAGEVLLNGDLVLQRARLYLPALRRFQTTKDFDPPMLLVAAGRVDTASVLAVDSTEAGPRIPSFSGRMRLKIPRATWLRGPRMNVELSGSLEATSDGKMTDIRGFLVVEQGSYEFYGRKFVFTQGRVDFEGGGEINPSVYFEVEYPFRTDEIENRLLIVVRGQSKNPIVEFFFNKDPISESDAISYIVFGRKVDDLNYGQKSTVTDLGDALAKDLAANMINSQLSSLVGSSLGLDVVRISGEENWDKAVLTAGKYVTDDIFVAYERGITQSGSSSVVFESARLEYYLMKFLYLHLIEATDKTSGVDVFLKFE